MRISTRYFWFTVLTVWVTAAVSAEEIRLPLSSGWTGRSLREAMCPQFQHQDTDQGEKIVIAAGASRGQHGWAEKTFPAQGGRYYRFSVNRKAEQVDEPRRSVVVRIKWTNDAGRMIPADIPPGREHDPGYAPLAEPEHPADGPVHANGAVTVLGVYLAPSRATQAHVELHLQWAPSGRVIWESPQFQETDPPPAREVRLASVHYMPTGKSPRQNCEEFAPLLAEAARQRADLAVLGETVPYVRVKQKPHEVAETIPGPTTEYFSKQARQHSLHIVLSLYELADDVCYNAAVLLGPDGKLIGKYRKVCLPHAEIEDGVTPGNEYPVFETKLGKIGMMVCYDGFFPEVARELTNQGAEIIAWPVWGCNPLLARARACENHVFLVSSTYSANSDWMVSAVFDRAGKPLIQAAKYGEVVTTTVDLSRPHFWKNNLGDFRAMIPRHRP